MTQDDDRLAGLDATIAALKAKTRRGLGQRAEAVAAAVGAWRAGEDRAIEVRRLAHKLRGAAENETLRALAEVVETSAAQGKIPTPDQVARLLTLAKESAKSNEPQASVRASKVSRRARVLVVDDDEAILRMVSMTLERVGGHDVVSASTADEAKHALDSKAFDVILLDAMMPETNGLELCGEARKRELQQDATLVVLSAANRSQLGWPQEGGPDHWWLKPMPGSLLVAEIGKLIDARRDDKRTA